MAKRKNDKKKIATDGSESVPAHNPFAQLLAGRSAPDSGVPEAQQTDAEGKGDEELPTRVMLRRERKDRGGKTVTIIEGLAAMAPAQFERLVRDLRKSLGVGATIEEDLVVVQGDIGDRVESFLLDAGVTTVRRAN